MLLVATVLWPRRTDGALFFCDTAKWAQIARAPFFFYVTPWIANDGLSRINSPCASNGTSHFEPDTPCSSMPQRVSAVTLALDDDVRTLLLCPNVPVLELVQCITAAFPALNDNRSHPLVAIQHATSRVFYPLSLLCRSPEVFETASYYLVVDRVAHTNPSHPTSDATDTHAAIDLSDFELPQLINVFMQACPTGTLSPRTFDRCVEKILSQSGRYDRPARTMFTRLFALFHAQSRRTTNVVDVADFLGGVSVFAWSERDETMRLTFDLYDVDGDGFISYDEMTKYLTAVFLVMGEASPELFQDTKCVCDVKSPWVVGNARRGTYFVGCVCVVVWSCGLLVVGSIQPS